MKLKAPESKRERTIRTATTGIAYSAHAHGDKKLNAEVIEILFSDRWPRAKFKLIKATIHVWVFDHAHTWQFVGSLGLRHVDSTLPPPAQGTAGATGSQP